MVMPVCAQEVLSGPQLATRVVLSICHNTSLALGVPSIYDLQSSWRGWYSLILCRTNIYFLGIDSKRAINPKPYTLKP